MIVVARTNPHDPHATALLQQSHVLMQSLFPPEENFFLSIDDLCAENIHFFTAREGGTVIGTGALVVKDGYGEIKSMFVSKDARGKGVADAILRQLEDHAKTEFLRMLKLETGNLLHTARRFYTRHKFVPCKPFGDYIDAPSSIFMEKRL